MKKAGREKVALGCGASVILWGQSFRAHGSMTHDGRRTKGEILGVSVAQIHACMCRNHAGLGGSGIIFDWDYMDITLDNQGHNPSSGEESLCLKVRECWGSKGEQWKRSGGVTAAVLE